MKENICKFVTGTSEEGLHTERFVLEKNPDIMKKGIKITQNVLFLITGGEGIIEVGQKRYAVSLGDLLFAFSGECVMTTENRSLEYAYICFGGTRAQTLLFRFRISKETRHLEGYDGLIPIWRESISRATDETVDLASEAMVIYTLSRLTVSKDAKNPLLQSILEITEEEYRDPDFSLSECSERLGYNSKYLSHFFKERMKVNFTDYLRTKRINYATMLFDNGIDSVKNVALLSGFSDPLYFSSVFKQVVGISPAGYSRRHTGESIQDGDAEIKVAREGDPENIGNLQNC